MCIIFSLIAVIIFSLLFIFIKSKRSLHFEYGVFIFAGASLVWLVNGVVSYMEGDGFISFGSIGMDLIISAWFIVLGLLLWLSIIVIPIMAKKIRKKK